ncbi:MAG: hypothetical protein HFJ50_01795 [Clostridia bacterium]|jgi:hypothetical protein|nr:hypothetical protein [Clostridia bacterium]
MKYKWNNEEEVTVYPTEEGDVSIEHKTPLRSGVNTVTVTVVNSNNITFNKSKEMDINKLPIIDLYIMGTTLYVTVRDEEGVAKVEQQINTGEVKTYQANGEKEFSYQYDIGNENIVVTITATDVRGAKKVYSAKNY